MLSFQSVEKVNRGWPVILHPSSIWGGTRHIRGTIRHVFSSPVYCIPDACCGSVVGTSLLTRGVRRHDSQLNREEGRPGSPRSSSVFLPQNPSSLHRAWLYQAVPVSALHSPAEGASERRLPRKTGKQDGCRTGGELSSLSNSEKSGSHLCEKGIFIKGRVLYWGKNLCYFLRRKENG